VPFVIRPIAHSDDQTIAGIIRQVMPEFGASGPGFALHDAEVDAMFDAYSGPRARYFVVEIEGTLHGGGGIAPLAGGAAGICELKKMYFLPGLRGLGAGRTLLETCLDFARTAGYGHCYVETLSGMDRAQALYRALGFEALTDPLGATGHFGCDRFYLRAL